VISSVTLNIPAIVVSVKIATRLPEVAPILKLPLLVSIVFVELIAILMLSNLTVEQ